MLTVNLEIIIFIGDGIGKESIHKKHLVVNYVAIYYYSKCYKYK